MAKLLIAGIGLAVFLLGIRFNLADMRLSGIMLMVVAFLLRFVKRRKPVDERVGE